MRPFRPWHAAVIPCVAMVSLSGCAGSSTGPKDGASAAGPAHSGSALPSDTAGGGRVVVTFTGTSPLSADAVRRTADRMRKRARHLAGAEVEERGDAVVVTGRAADRTRLEALGDTGELLFRPVLAVDVAGPPQPSGSPTPSQGRALTRGLGLRTDPSAVPSAGADASGAADAALQKRFTALDCSGKQDPVDRQDRPQDSVVACGDEDDATGRDSKYLLGPAALGGSDIKSAKAEFGKNASGWLVQLDFTSAGSAKFADVTGRLSANQSPQNQFAIVLDGTVMSAPYVNQSITGGKAEIAGSFDRHSAEQLAATLDTGALPVDLKVSEVTTLPAG
ncbi:SecDF P1 head subdomain-containing protein [Streptomyces krungchingensis]